LSSQRTEEVRWRSRTKGFEGNEDVRAGAEARIIISKWRADAGETITFSDGTS